MTVHIVCGVRISSGLARAAGRIAAACALGAALAAGCAVAGAGVAAADPAPTPAPAAGVPDLGVRPSPNPVVKPNSTPSPIGPPPTSTPAPGPTQTPNPTQGPTPPGWTETDDDATDNPGMFDIPGQIRKAINDFFVWVVKSALNPVLSALGESMLTTPDLPGDARVRTMWTTSLAVANAIFVLFIVLAGFVVASRETLQTSYGLKEVLPRLAVAGILMNTSLLLAGKAIDAANAITAGIAGQGVNGQTAAAALTQALGEVMRGNSFLLTLMVLGVLVMAIVVVFTFVLRIVFLTILIGIAPLGLLCHALPQTEQLAFTWWRGFAACLGIQVGQAVVLLAALRMFLTPADGNSVAGPGLLTGAPNPSRLLSILVVAAVVWLLLKIPGWMRHFVLGPLARSGGRGLVGQILHAVVMVKTLGAAAGLVRCGSTAVGRRAAATGTRRAVAAGSPLRQGRTAPSRTAPRVPRRVPQPRPGSARPVGRPAPAPAMFSSAPAVHAPLPRAAGTNGPVTFSHPPTPATANPSRGDVPPMRFSNPPAPPAPIQRPTAAARPAPAPFLRSGRSRRTRVPGYDSRGGADVLGRTTSADSAETPTDAKLHADVLLRPETSRLIVVGAADEPAAPCDPKQSAGADVPAAEVNPRPAAKSSSAAVRTCATATASASEASPSTRE